MAHRSIPERRGFPLMSTTTLALWRLKRTGGMLFFTGLGLLAAVMLVCAIPLYSRVATTAGLRGVLTSSRDAATVTFHMATSDLRVNSVDWDTSLGGREARPAALYLDEPPQMFIPTQSLKLLSPQLPTSADTFSLLAAPIKNVPAHAKLLHGRFPRTTTDTSDPIEIAVTAATAASMRLSVGSTLQAALTGSIEAASTRHATARLPLHVVGIYMAEGSLGARDESNDVFWHGYPLDPITNLSSRPITTNYSALLSSDELLHLIDEIGGNGDFSKKVGTYGNFGGEFVPDQITDLYWYYQINTSRLDIVQLDDLITQLSNWQGNVSNDSNTTNMIDLSGATIPAPLQQTILEQYRARFEVTSIPVTILLLQVVALILFFITLMTDLLIERQEDTIAVLRSRGANKRQLFGAFFTQGVGLGLLALLVGPILAIVGVFLVSQHALTSQEQGALTIISRNPLAILSWMRGYALLAFSVSAAAMAFATSRAVGFNVPGRRREMARSTIRPLWQRLNLDLVTAVIALIGYVVSLYLTSLQGLDARTQELVISPLALIAPLFLLLAGVLVLLRLFPWLLHLGANMATRGRGVAAMLAFGQMSRAPRHSLRLLLLLTLTGAFALFALVFSASQVQHINDLADYQVGADFSGPLPTTDATVPLTQETSLVQHISGVLSATPGYASTAVTGGNNSLGIQLRAVDADTFAQTALWTSQDSSQSLASLMQQLVAQRSTVAQMNALPVIVDANTWNALNLTQGARFELHVTDPDGTDSGTISCIALADVQRIPTTASSGGVLLDYQSYAMLYSRVFHRSLPLNYLWVKTKDDATSVNTVRNALTTMQPLIQPLGDRRALVSQLSQDPLTLDLLGVLALGAATALLLALVGNLLASWLSARNRQTSFVVLRALGTSSQQVAGVLTWEQGIIYITAILLGIFFGALLAITAIPSLVFSTAPVNEIAGGGISTNDFYALQHLLPVRLAVSPSLAIDLLILIGICLLALLIMIRVVTRPEPGQILRLNED
jgi:ABC-type antimicrobial peptide transport system permease subunit